MKRAERVERLEEKHAHKAGVALKEADSRNKVSHAMAGIMNGQPILIGHHSEKRHRRDIERMNTNSSKSTEAWRYSQEQSRMESNVENQAGISRLDDDRVVLMERKIESLESVRDGYKAENVAARKAKQPRARNGWELSNLGARIRDCKRRLEQFKTDAERGEYVPLSCVVVHYSKAGELAYAKMLTFSTEHNEEKGSIDVTFSSRLSSVMFKHMRSNGFLWVRSLGCFRRGWNNATEHRLREIASVDFKPWGI